MTEDEAIKKVLAVARSNIGYHEGVSNSNKFSSMTGNLYGWQIHNAPWCDIFVDACFIQAFGYEYGSAITYQYEGCSGAACAQSAEYYKRNGAYFYTQPRPGDQIFFNCDGGINHTGIIEEVSNGWITTIEGNSSDQVKRNKYRTTEPSINGYGHPNWKALTKLDPDFKPESGTGNNENKQPGRTSDFISDLDADGEFGPLTEETLRRFQELNGLEDDGRAGPETAGKIAEILGKRTIKRNDIGWAVTALQAALNAVAEYQ